MMQKVLIFYNQFMSAQQLNAVWLKDWLGDHCQHITT